MKPLQEGPTRKRANCDSSYRRAKKSLPSKIEGPSSPDASRRAVGSFQRFTPMAGAQQKAEPRMAPLDNSLEEKSIYQAKFRIMLSFGL